MLFLQTKIYSHSFQRQDINTMHNHSKHTSGSSRLWFTSIAILIISLACLCSGQQYKKASISADNVCTFHIADRLFSLLYLEQASPYAIELSADKKILFNFCTSFVPTQCQNAGNTSSQTTDSLSGAFAWTVTTIEEQMTNEQTEQTSTVTRYTCQRYSSDSYIYYFKTDYVKHRQQPELILNMSTGLVNDLHRTEFHIFCSGEEYFKIQDYELNDDQNTLSIRGESTYGCPVFQISSLWTTLQNHSFIFGMVLFVLGFQMLFYGLLMINLTVFIAGYFISFALLGAIFTVFLGPDSSSIAVYFSLLFILLASTLIAYGLTKLIGLSIFFIGAFFGLIVGALVNTLFAQLFSIHSVWSLVIFEILFIIPFGLLTFKYSNEIIIMSTSLTGSYFIVRPISWLLGGFPNEFTLYHMYETYELTSLPWSFYLYVLLIIVHAIMGALYQILKLQREDPNNTIETNMVTENIEAPLDKIKTAVDKIIARYSSSDADEDNYKRYKEMSEQKHDYLVEESDMPSTYTPIQKQSKKGGKLDDQFF